MLPDNQRQRHLAYVHTSRFLDLRAGAAQSNLTLQRGGGHDAAHPNEIMRDTLSFKHD